MGEMSGARPVLRYGGQRGHTLIPAKVGPSADRTPIQNQQNPRHSRGRGRFSGRNIHPESTTPPSFPRASLVIPADAGTQNQQSTPFHPIPATTTIPFARRGWTNP